MEPSNKIFTIPNLLAFYRITAAPVAFYLIIQDIQPLAFILVFSAFSTDLVDGYIARKFNQISNLGIILDPIADKLLFVFVLFGILIKTEFYQWLTTYSILALFYIIAYLLVHKLFVERKIKVVRIGKICVFFNSIILIIFTYGYVSNPLLYLFTSLLLITPIIYMFNIIKYIK
jgi:cardiolipin synthase (CMP-forming)